MNIYCIVVTYNGSKWVQDCFGSLQACSLPMHIVAIDNASTDRTVELIRTGFPSVKVIESGSNIGFGKANNIGLNLALDNNVDFVFLLNQDAWIQPGCIEKLVESFELNPSMGIISPVHLNASGNDFDTHFAAYVNGLECPGYLTDRFFGRQKNIYPTKFINAAAWMLSRNTIEIVGGFDPLFPHYGEDDDYVERVHNAGLQVGINPVAFIHHDAAPGNEEAFKRNVQRLKIYHLVQLKRVSNSYRSNWLKFLKSEWDIQTTMLLFRKFNNWWFRYRVAVSMLEYYKSVKKARIKSKEAKAFLN